MWDEKKQLQKYVDKAVSTFVKLYLYTSLSIYKWVLT